MSGERTGFLYPFIDADERDSDNLIRDLAASARAKSVESRSLREAMIETYATELDEIAAELAERVQAGGRLFSFGNGGSSTDAAALALLFAKPPSGRPIAARTLASDEAILTALGNDVGYELVFSRQLIAYAKPGDIAIGYSTSGNSANLMRAFDEARHRELLTIGFAGYEGGEMAASALLDHCLVVPSSSVHRIQEAQDALTFSMWERLQERLDAAATASSPTVSLEASRARVGTR
ncbi:MAG: D-sedoheptulose-7-phosphate isomerase [Acidimicrobiales bacterium]